MESERGGTAAAHAVLDDDGAADSDAEAGDGAGGVGAAGGGAMDGGVLAGRMAGVGTEGGSVLSAVGNGSIKKNASSSSL